MAFCLIECSLWHVSKKNVVRISQSCVKKIFCIFAHFVFISVLCLFCLCLWYLYVIKKEKGREIRGFQKNSRLPQFHFHQLEVLSVSELLKEEIISK